MEKVRVAKTADLEDVLEMSKGFYQEHDYLTSSVLLKRFNDPNRTILVVENDSKPVGLMVIHVVDDGTTAMLESFRVHPEYRGQGFGKRLVHATEQYIHDHFPAVKVHRHLSSAMSDPLSAMRERTGRGTILREIAVFGCSVTPSYTLLGKDLESVEQDKVTPISQSEFKELLERKELEHIVPQEILLVELSLFRTLPSNISVGLVDDNDRLFISRDDNPNSLTCLSHGRFSRRVKYAYWSVTVYTDNQVLLKAHIVKQLKIAKLKFDEKPFFICFSVSKSMMSFTSDFIERDLLLNSAESYQGILIVVEKVVGLAVNRSQSQ